MRDEVKDPWLDPASEINHITFIKRPNLTLPFPRFATGRIKSPDPQEASNDPGEPRERRDIEKV